MHRSNISVIVAGDIPFLNELLKMTIQEAQFTIAGVASTPEKLLEMCRTDKPDIVIFDFQIKEIECIRLVESILDIDANIAIIVITEAVHGHAEKLLVSGARAFLQKPFSTYDIIDILDKVSPIE